jgi:hypothetical protein
MISLNGISSARKPQAPPLPPPATFSRTSSADILFLKHQPGQEGDSNSDRSIRNEVFGMSEGRIHDNIDRPQRVRARQVAAEEKTFIRRQQGRNNWDCSSSCGSSVSSAHSSSISISRSSSSSMPSKQARSAAHLACLKDTLAGLEADKPWYLFSHDELLKFEQIKAQIGEHSIALHYMLITFLSFIQGVNFQLELMSFCLLYSCVVELETLEKEWDRDEQAAAAATRNEVDSLSLSASLHHHKHNHKHGTDTDRRRGRRGSGGSVYDDDDDDISCVSSLSDNSTRVGR